MKRWRGLFMAGAALEVLWGIACIDVGHSAEVGCLVDMTEPGCGATMPSDAAPEGEASSPRGTTDAESDSAGDARAEAVLDATNDSPPDAPGDAVVGSTDATPDGVTPSALDDGSASDGATD